MAKSKTVVEGEFDVVVSAMVTLLDSLQSEIDTYGSDGDGTLSGDLESCYLANVATLERARLNVVNQKANVTSRYKTL